LEFALSSLTAASDEQYESILDDEITLLVRKFRALHKFRKKRRKSPRGCFECGDTTHFIFDCSSNKKKLDSSSNKYNYNNWNESSDKGESKKKYRFGDKKKKFQKIDYNTIHTPCHQLQLNKILHVPQASKNNISVHRFASVNNIFLEFYPHFFCIKDLDSRSVLLTGHAEVVSILYLYHPSRSLSLERIK
jgi:hypothetical protein